MTPVLSWVYYSITNESMTSRANGKDEKRLHYERAVRTIHEEVEDEAVGAEVEAEGGAEMEVAQTLGKQLISATYIIS